MTRMTLAHFKKYVLPQLQAESQDMAELQVKVSAFVGETELVNAEGVAIDVESVVLVPAKAVDPDEDEDEDEDDDEDNPLGKAGDDSDEDDKKPVKKPKKAKASGAMYVDAKTIQDIVSKAVGAALTAANGTPKRKAVHVDKATGHFTVPATAKRYGRTKNFTGPDADVKAFRFGMWCAALMGKGFAQEYCSAHDLPFIHTKAGHEEGTDSLGGALVLPEFSTDIINLREMYGVFRANAYIVPMGSDTKLTPRMTGGLTAYFPGEANSITESETGFDQVQLVARKIAALTRRSNELEADAIINFGDMLAGEIAYAFAQKEDECGFIGDGTSTYGGIIGLIPKIDSLHATPTNVAGISVASSSSWTSITDADMMSLLGKLPEYAETPNAKFYCSKPFWATVMERLARAAGGATTESRQDRPPAKMYGGYEVVVTQTMARVEAASANLCLFGDIGLASKFGDRAMLDVAMSDSASDTFENDQVMVRGTSRFDIVVHDVGNASTATTSQEAGPIVLLKAST